MADEKVATVKAELQRLLDANVIREVKYPTWLANTVPVKKKNGKWRMCIDFTDLNNGARRPKSSPTRSRCCEIEPASRGIPPLLLLGIGPSDRLPEVDPPSETLPNSFAGIQRRKASTPEGRPLLARLPHAREPTFGCEGDSWSLKSTG